MSMSKKEKKKKKNDDEEKETEAEGLSLVKCTLQGLCITCRLQFFTLLFRLLGRSRLALVPTSSSSSSLSLGDIVFNMIGVVSWEYRTLLKETTLRSRVSITRLYALQPVLYFVRKIMTVSVVISSKEM